MLNILALSIIASSNGGFTRLLGSNGLGPTQPLTAQNHTRGGLWEPFDRTITESLVAALDVIVLHAAAIARRRRMGSKMPHVDRE